MTNRYRNAGPQPEPPLSPEDDDERSEEEIREDEEARDAKLISDYEDRMSNTTPPDNWP